MQEMEEEFMQKRKSLKLLLIWLFCLAVILGPAYSIFDNYDYNFETSPDIETYLGLAKLDFDQSPTRRYRVIVPMLARGLNMILSPILNQVKPWTFPGPDFSLGFCFLIINSMLVALFGLLIFLFLRAMKISVFGAIVGLLSILTCRWTAYAAGLPMVDSLYLVVIGLTLYGIFAKKHKFIILAILLGPWAKESFIFIAPLIFFFSDIPKVKQVGWFVLSGILIFGFRYFFDVMNDFPVNEGLVKDISHFEEVTNSLRRLLSFHGFYEVLSIFGVWGLLLLSLFHSRIRLGVRGRTPLFFWLYLAVVLIHALLSLDLARMLYLGVPILAVWYGWLVDSGRDVIFRTYDEKKVSVKK